MRTVLGLGLLGFALMASAPAHAACVGNQTQFSIDARRSGAEATGNICVKTNGNFTGGLNSGRCHANMTGSLTTLNGDSSVRLAITAITLPNPNCDVIGLGKSRNLTLQGAYDVDDDGATFATVSSGLTPSVTITGQEVP